MNRVPSSSFVRVAVVIAAIAGAAGPTMAQADAVNSECPISHEPVDGKTFVQHDGRKIGLCCGGCRRQFEAWSGDRKTAFVTAALGTAAPPPTKSGGQPTSRPAEGAPVGGVYTLETCAVSGAKLGSMGEPVVRQYEGREVRFCCAGCIGKFEADRGRFFDVIDKAIIAEQKRIYPIETCVVSGEPLVEDGKDIAVNHVIGNRLVRLCCKGCVRSVKRDPAPALQKLDEAILAQQIAHYPSETCVVSGEPLDAMGGPVDVIAGNRLVRLCCKSCLRGFNREPAKYVATVDIAWKRRGGGRAHGGTGHDHDH